jgi:PAS domain S-box-containing protein
MAAAPNPPHPAHPAGSRSTTRRFADLAARRALRIALLYLALGFAWILLSDRAVDTLIADPGARSIVSTVKGWAYVAVTGLLLFVLVRNDLARELRVQRALRASEARLRTLLESVDLCALLLDRQGRVVFANAFLARLLGRPREELEGRDWFETAIPEPHRGAQREVFRQIMAGDVPVGRSEGEIVAAEGIRRISWHCAALRDAEGSIVGLTAIGEDRTEQLRLEAHLQRIERMEAIGQLAGGIAHDFNNLLTVIGGHADLILADAPPDGAVAAEAAEIRAAVERASGLTRQLLAVSRRQVLEPRPVDVVAVVDALVPMLRRLFGERIELVVDAPGQGAWIEADPSQLEQVVLNLAVNARDAMPDGGRLAIGIAVAEVGAELEPKPQPLDRDAVVLTVRDTGTGMTPEVATRAFEPFFTTKPSGVGTGLGLATVYGIVRQSGGEIFLDSAPGAGTTVTIVLPRIDPPAETAATAEARGTDWRGGTVLVVEDEAPIRALVRRILERDGYTVVDADDGVAVEALAASLDRPPDLVLSDVVLPGITASELVARIRARWPRVPIVLMSGYAAPEAGLEQLGTATPFLPKPFTPDQLRRTLQAALTTEAAGVAEEDPAGKPRQQPAGGAAGSPAGEAGPSGAAGA